MRIAARRWLRYLPTNSDRRPPTCGLAFGKFEVAVDLDEAAPRARPERVGLPILQLADFVVHQLDRPTRKAAACHKQML